MALNTGKLAGKTIFITGASRGIGRAIALKAAQDGANVVIAAKTTEPHPKLPGTIYTTAAEVEKAGGSGLACVVDIRNEEQVVAAVEATVKKFGGIDILVNNASAIQLTGTLETPMKKFDLMHSINGRGTYLCSQTCIPYLKKSKNPHILNLSPPLTMQSIWFQNHVAYTMAKYMMSMCVLGMSPELASDGIAVNALWPRTAIWTAAMKMLGGGTDDVRSQCRKESIMADAAYVILCKNSRETTNTGNFYIDDEVLFDADPSLTPEVMEAKYSEKPGSKLLPDFFLPVKDNEGAESIRRLSKKAEKSGSKAGNPAVTDVFGKIESLLKEKPEHVSSVKGHFRFILKDSGETFGLNMSDTSVQGSRVSVLTGAEAKPENMAEFESSTEDFLALFHGKIRPTAAFMAGKLKIKGNMGLAIKLERLLTELGKDAKL